MGGFRWDIVNLINVGEDFNFTIRYEYMIKTISLVAYKPALISIVLIFRLPYIA